MHSDTIPLMSRPAVPNCQSVDWWRAVNSCLPSQTLLPQIHPLEKCVGSGTLGSLGVCAGTACACGSEQGAKGCLMPCRSGSSPREGPTQPCHRLLHNIQKRSTNQSWSTCVEPEVCQSSILQGSFLAPKLRCFCGLWLPLA